MKSQITRLEDGTIQLNISIPWPKVEEARKGLVQNLSQSAKVPGFRKGKAPQKLVNENINEGQVREDILKNLLPETYIAAIEEHKIRPIVNPKIHVEKLDDHEDWTYTALTCEMPKVDLGEYKKEITKISAKNKIVTSPSDAEKTAGESDANFEEIMKTLLESAKVTIPSLLSDQEVDRLLSQTLQEIKSLGLTLEQYMASTKKTPEDLRNEYKQKAENDIKLEFILQEIADTEKLTVSELEVVEAISKAKDPMEKQHLEANRPMLTNILRQQKTLDFIRSL